MTRFTTHSPASAPADARPILEQAQKSYGFVPNLMGVLAESPAAARGYATISRIFEDTELTPTERQVVLLTASRYNGCQYCVAAHSVIAGMQQVDTGVVDAIRDDEPIGDERLEALRRFTHKVVERRGELSAEDIDELLAAGYGQRTVLEVILGVAMKTISNYTNHLADTELDAAFEDRRWSGGSVKAA